MARAGNNLSPSRNSTPWEAAIRKFLGSNLTSEQLRQRVPRLLNSKKLLQNIQGLTPEDQTSFVDKVYQVFPAIDPQSTRFMATLGDVCSATGQLPTPVVLSAELQKIDDIAIDSGGMGDIWRGTDRGKLVAIKAFRIYPTENLKAVKEILWKRVLVWMKLSHENILPFHGVTTTLFALGLVYDWGQNGNINQYIALHPDAPRPIMLYGVAKGLRYLHSLDIPHGDVKGANVIIDQWGRACLTEYGLATVNSDLSFTVAATPGTLRTSRWLAPELINPPSKNNGAQVVESKPADVFSFPMLAVEVFTGQVPFGELEDEAVAPRILQGGRPGMPVNAQAVGLTNDMWKLIESCWRRDPKKRPTMEEVVMKWGKFVELNDSGGALTEPPRTAQQRIQSAAPQPRAPKRWNTWSCGFP